jgi:uncharacterized protein YprB with RNaseH-like and TPR domain
MGWVDYYNLLVKYGGDLSKASEEELRSAEEGNPNNPYDALMLAIRKYREYREGLGCKAIIDIETTGLEPLRDRIIVIGLYVLDTGDSVIIDCSDNEEMGLRAFWGAIEKYNIVKLYGFGIDFDWTFIKLRSLKYKIKILRHFKKWEGRFDLRQILNSNRFAKGTLRDYAEFLGLHINDDCHGHTVPELYKLYLDGHEKALEDIIRHLKRDLERTKHIYDVLKECGLLEEEG